MSEELPENKHTTTVLYKAKDGALKELRVVQPLDPAQQRLTITDIRLLAREISNVLKEDAF